MFVEARRHTWAANLGLLDEARPVLAALAAAGIRTMLLKGAVLANLPYGEPGLRPMGDVDVLVDPVHAREAARIVEELGWVVWRGPGERDLLLGHSLDMWKPPHGALDLHWYSLAECRWDGADLGAWQRALPMTSIGSTTVVPAAADLLLHVCVHGLRWSIVHAGHWVADAVRIIQAGGEQLDWDVVVAEASHRRLVFQMAQALRVVRERGHVDVPQVVVDTLERQPGSWSDRLECRFKTRPLVSEGGLLVIWAAWRRSAAGARAAGRPRPSWTRFLAATLALETPSALGGRFTARAWERMKAIVRRAPPRGGSTRTRLAVHK